MNSEIVYQVAKALPREEQLLLFDKLRNDFITSSNRNHKKRNEQFKKEDAILYLLSNVFNHKWKKQ